MRLARAAFAATVLLLALISGPLPALAGENGCPVPHLGCPVDPVVENQGDRVAIGGTQTIPGHGDGDRRGDGWDVGPRDGDRDGDTGADSGEDCGSPLAWRCPLSVYEIWMPEITMADLAVFAPAPPALSPEPAGVGIVGMPVNFVVDARTHTVDGELFDLPLRVRFSPAAYDFSYGDGASSRTATGGQTWPALGVPQFTATATSHAYPARGTYTAHVDIDYTAAVDLGSGWYDIPGVLTVATGGATVEILELRTALVERTCLEDPTGPGC